MFKGKLILAMCYLYLSYYFFQIEFLHYGLLIITVLVLALGIKGASKAPRIMGVTLVSFGILFNFQTNSGLLPSLTALFTNLPLLTLLILVPLIAVPMKTGGYFQSAHYFMAQWKENSQRAYLGLTGFLTLVAPILNMGSVRILHEMVDDLKLKDIVLGKSYIVGFSTAMLWSPYFASVALVLYYVNLKIVDYLFVGLVFAAIQFLAGYFLFGVQRKAEISQESKEIIKDDNEQGFHKRKITQLVLMIVLLIGTLLILESITKVSMLILVSLLSLFIPFAWGIVTKNWKGIAGEFTEFKQSLSWRMDNEITLFLSAGFFGSALSNTVFSKWIKQFLTIIASYSISLFIISVVLLVFIFAMAGVHQIIVIPILAMQTEPFLLGTSPVVLAFLFIFSWTISAIASPFNAINMLVSSTLNKNGITVGLKWNGVYLLIILVIGLVYIYSVHLILS